MVLLQENTVSFRCNWNITEKNSLIPGRAKRFFPSPKCSECLCGTLSHLFSGYWWFNGLRMKLTVQPHLVLRLKIAAAYTWSPFHAFTLCAGTILTLPVCHLYIKNITFPLQHKKDKCGQGLQQT